MLTVATVAVVIGFLILGTLLVVLRRFRRARLASARNLPSGRRVSNAPKPWNAPGPGSYPAYYQTAPPAPAPVYTPQYPPHGHETYHGYSQSQRVPPSSIPSVTQPTTPRSPVSTRAPSGTTSRPISSVNPTPLSVRSSVHRNEPAILLPSNPSSSSPISSPRSTQRDVVESPLRPQPSSLAPRSPSVVVPSAASAPLPRLSVTTSPPRNPPPPLPFAPMSTGASYTIDEPPPAYTPI